MPIYGYVCKQCGHEFEVLQGINETPLKSCPECMGPLQKLLYPVGVIFKGSGFYTTDYRAGSKGASGDGAERREKGEKGEKAEKAEKPAAKAESESGSKAKDGPAA
jgi:putative FmdB family regulatory protein